LRTVAILLLTAATGCSSSNDVASNGEDAGAGCVGFCPTDAQNDLPIPLQVKDTIDHICANVDGCHGSGVEGLTLVYGNEFSDMIDVSSTEVSTLLRVKPFDPDNSYVYRKLACGPDGGYIDACMPLGAPNPAIASLFRVWIEAGAPTQ
jgi:hypothetical protein